MTYNGIKIHEKASNFRTISGKDHRPPGIPVELLRNLPSPQITLIRIIHYCNYCKYTVWILDIRNCISIGFNDMSFYLNENKLI